jgi:hypothetical protein
MERGVRWLIERVPDKPCIYVPGNHEFYGCDIDRTVEKARAAAAGTNVHVMQDDTVTIGGITFLGATLWTDFDLFGDPDYAMATAGETMNDYRKIRMRSYELRLRPKNTLKRHMVSRDFIARELRKGGRRHVVVTHMGPHPGAARRGFERDISSAAYTSDLSALIAELQGLRALAAARAVLGQPQLRPDLHHRNLSAAGGQHDRRPHRPVFDADRCREPSRPDFEYDPMLSTAPRADLFISAKTTTAIPALHPLVRDALVQASLDPQVRALEFVPTAMVEAAQVALQAIVVVRDDGRFHLDVVDARRVRDIDEEGLALIALGRLGLVPLTLTAADIKREPRFANARAVWAYRLHPVGIEMRLRILTVLQEDGPLPLGCLLKRVRTVRDPAPAVMALACSDLIELELVSRPLGPATMVRSRTS